jgi:hypothetical protein
MMKLTEMTEIFPGVLISNICLQSWPCKHAVKINDILCEYPMDGREIYKMIDEYNIKNGANVPFGHFKCYKPPNFFERILSNTFGEKIIIVSPWTK